MILFISDIHLQESRKETTRAFLDFLEGPARAAETLWILGDLFEFWIGDDDLAAPFHARIADALASLSHAGVSVKLIVGNRDFALGAKFAQRAGLEIVPEPAVISIGTRRIALMHGDAECTDDVAYQRYRKRIRSPFTLAFLRCLPLAFRRMLANRIRSRSLSATPYKTSKITDVNPSAIADLFRKTEADLMIHGHTHRAARHVHLIDEQEKLRWVLPDWHEHACWLEASTDGFVPHFPNI